MPKLLKSQIDCLKSKLIAELKTFGQQVCNRKTIANDVSELLTSETNTGLFHHKGGSVDTISYLVSIIPFCILSQRSAVILCPDYKVNQIMGQLKDIKLTGLIDFETNTEPQNINQLGVSVISYEALAKTLDKTAPEASLCDNSVFLLLDPQLMDSIAIESSVTSLDLDSFLNTTIQTQSLINQLAMIGKRSEPTFILNTQLATLIQSTLSVQNQLNEFRQMVGASSEQIYCFQELLPRRVQQATKKLLVHTKDLIVQIKTCLANGANLDQLLEITNTAHDAISDFLQLNRQKWLIYSPINDTYSVQSSVKNATSFLVGIQSNASINKIFVSPCNFSRTVQETIDARYFQYVKQNKTSVAIPSLPYEMKDPLMELWIKENLVEHITRKSTVIFFSNRQLMHRARIAIEQQCTNHQILLQVEGDAPLEKQINNHQKALSLNIKSVILASHQSKRQLVSTNTMFELVGFFGLPFDQQSSTLMQRLYNQCVLGENRFELITLPRALLTMSEIITNLLGNDGDVILFDKRMISGLSYTLDVTTYLMESHQCEIV